MRKEFSQNRKKLSVHMLGDIQFSLDGEEMKLPGGIFSKTMNLFFLVLLYGEQGIPKKRVQSLLYGEEEYDRGTGSLRVVAHRLKRQLIAAGLMGEDDTLSEKGIFRWQPEGLEIEVDVRNFEEAAQKALKEGAGQEERLARACHLYTGEMLPELISEMWVAENQAYLQELYFACMHKYMDLLYAKGAYERMLPAVRETIRMYPYEEWYVAELDALIGMGQWEEALEVSRRSSDSLMEKYGIQPSKEMLARISTINNRLTGSTKELRQIQGELEEKDRMEGGFYCNYLSFTWAYRYEMRQLERTGGNHYLLLCSLTEKTGTLAARGDAGLERAMEELNRAAGDSLRRNDIYTRYSKNQILALLMNVNREECAAVSARIDRVYQRRAGTGKYRVHYFHVPVVGKPLQIEKNKLCV